MTQETIRRIRTLDWRLISLGRADATSKPVIAWADGERGRANATSEDAKEMGWLGEKMGGGVKDSRKLLRQRGGRGKAEWIMFNGQPGSENKE